MSDSENMAKKFLGKMEDMMAEIAEEMLDDATKMKIEEKLRTLLQKEGVGFSLPNIKALYQGMRLMMIVMGRDDSQMAMTMMIAARGMIAKREKQVKATVDNSIEK